MIENPDQIIDPTIPITEKNDPVSSSEVNWNQLEANMCKSRSKSKIRNKTEANTIFFCFLTKKEKKEGEKKVIITDWK